MAFFWSTSGPSPCPVCDAELASPTELGAQPNCAECGHALTPIEVASGTRRSAAFAADLGVLLLTAAPLTWLLQAAVGLEPLTDGQGIDALLQILAGDLWAPVGRAMPFFVMSALYFALFSTLMGQTPGQRLLKIRIVDFQGRGPSVGRSLVRVLSGMLSLVPAGLGAIWMFFDDERRAMHDHLAQTYVVRAG